MPWSVFKARTYILYKSIRYIIERETSLSTHPKFLLPYFFFSIGIKRKGIAPPSKDSVVDVDVNHGFDVFLNLFLEPHLG